MSHEAGGTHTRRVGAGPAHEGGQGGERGVVVQHAERRFARARHLFDDLEAGVLVLFGAQQAGGISPCDNMR